MTAIEPEGWEVTPPAGATVAPPPVFQPAPPAVAPVFQPAPPAPALPPMPIPPPEGPALPPAPVPGAPPALPPIQVATTPAEIAAQGVADLEAQRAAGAGAEANVLAAGEARKAAAGIEAGQAQEQSDLQAEYAQIRERVTRDATAAYNLARQNLDDAVEAHGKADFHGYWSDKSTGDKVLAGIALAFGAFGAGLSGFAGIHTGNLAAEAIMRNMDADFERQRAGIAKLKDQVVMARTGLMDAASARQAMLQDVDARELAAHKAVDARATAALKARGVGDVDIATNAEMLKLRETTAAKAMAANERISGNVLKAAVETAHMEKERAEAARLGRRGTGGGGGGAGIPKGKQQIIDYNDKGDAIPRVDAQGKPVYEATSTAKAISDANREKSDRAIKGGEGPATSAEFEYLDKQISGLKAIKAHKQKEKDVLRVQMPEMLGGWTTDAHEARAQLVDQWLRDLAMPPKGSPRFSERWAKVLKGTAGLDSNRSIYNEKTDELDRAIAKVEAEKALLQRRGKGRGKDAEGGSVDADLDEYEGK